MIDIKNLKINLERKILESEKLIIVPHNSIDFDAIGSAIGLALVGNKLKKSTHILVNDLPYKMDHGCKLIVDEAKEDFDIIDKNKYTKIDNPNDLFVLTDVNKKHLISIPEILTNPNNIFIIDHHEKDSDTVNSNNIYIDSNVSSASEIIYHLLDDFDIKIPDRVANYLLSGIYLDTNKYTKNTSAKTMLVVAKLLELGASMNTVTNWFTEDFESDRRVQELVSKVEIIRHSIAIIKASEDMEYVKEELAKAADYSLKYEIDAAFAIGNIGENVVAVSARSKEKVDVGEVMKDMGGGGHKYSAACQLQNTTIEEVGKKLVKKLTPAYYV